MPQSVQIVPTYHYPYVHTVINDNSQIVDDVTVNQQDPVITFAFPFVSGKGIDNQFVKKTSLAGCKQTFGESNYKKYGQPYMMPLNVLNERNANVWCMRVMPENAAYSNTAIVLWYKTDADSISSYVKVPEEDLTTTDVYTPATSTDDGALKVVLNDEPVITFTPATSSTQGALLVVDNDTSITVYTEAEAGAETYLTVVANDAADFDPETQVKVETVAVYSPSVATIGNHVVASTVEFDNTTMILDTDVTGITVDPGDYVTKTTITFNPSTMVVIDDVVGDIPDVEVGNYVLKVQVTEGPEGSLKVVADNIIIFDEATMIKKSSVLSDLPEIEIGDFVILETITPAASEKKFRIKYTQQNIVGAKTVDEFNAAVKALDLAPDADGYTPVVFATLRSEGRGTYGDNYRLRVKQDLAYEKEYGIKMYDFEILSNESGLMKIGTYTGSIVSSVKYDASTLINDILSNVDAGVAPMLVNINEENLEDVYDAYVEFCKKENAELINEYAEIMDSEEVKAVANFDMMVKGLVNIPAALKPTVLKVRELLALIEISSEANIITIDEFDPVLGLDVAKNTANNFIRFDTSDGTISFSDSKGISIGDGSNGYFDEPRVTNSEGEIVIRKRETTVDDYGNIVDVLDENGNPIYINDNDGNPIYVNTNGDEFDYLSVKLWTVDEEIELCYNQAFNGTLDQRILSVRRIGVDAWFDANYPDSVKGTMTELAVTRNDAMVYLDTGITDASYSISTINSITTKIANIFADHGIDTDEQKRMISVNLQHFKTRESSTMKKVTVSITYFLARQFAAHLAQYGYYVPLVKGRCELYNHVKDSLEPSIDDYQAQIKETIYNNKFNFFETLGENQFQRATQVTYQTIESDLSEENNVHTLYRVKRIIEADIHDRLYDFADETTRATFTEYEKAKFAPWIGSRFQSFTINFTVNNWEFEHSIVHCYVAIVFRSLQKQAILEIDINKRELTTEDSTNSSNEFQYAT